MVFHLSKSGVPLLVAAMGAMVLSAGAQPSDRSIVFSTPQTDDAQAATPSLAPQNSQMPVLPGTLQAPMTPFNYNAPDSFPVLPPPANAGENQQMKKLLEERKNWTLMTPAEIFGVTATEKLLQPPERDAMGREKDQTQLERYLDRENRSRSGATNDLQNGREDLPWNFSTDKNNASPFDTSRYGADATAQNLDRFLNGRRAIDVSPNQNAVVNWDSLNPPAPQTSDKQNLDQMAAMARFQQLLAPGSAPAEPSPDSRFFPVPKAVVDPNITQPDFVPNPAGASFAPLTDGIGKPAGLTPLPGVVTSTPQPAVTPAWAPQPAPWLLQGPQPGVMPQRKF